LSIAYFYWLAWASFLPGNTGLNPPLEGMDSTGFKIANS